MPWWLFEAQFISEDMHHCIENKINKQKNVYQLPIYLDHLPTKTRQISIEISMYNLF